MNACYKYSVIEPINDVLLSASLSCNDFFFFSFKNVIKAEYLSRYNCLWKEYMMEMTSQNMKVQGEPGFIATRLQANCSV